MLAEETIGTPIAPLRTEADYDTAVAEVEALWGSPPETPEGDRLDVLMDLVEAFEARHHAIEPPDPIDAIEIRMAYKGYPAPTWPGSTQARRRT